MSRREYFEKKNKSEPKANEPSSRLGNFIYHHTKTDDWPILRACLLQEFMKESISHLLYPEQIEEMKRDPSPPRVIPEPPSETPTQRAERLNQQSLFNQDWLERKKECRRRCSTKLQSECQMGMGILLDHVDRDIRIDLQAQLDKPENSRLTDEERWNMLWQRVESEWGPQSHLDVQALKDKLQKLDGDQMRGGWLAYWNKFTEIVSALERIEMRDEHSGIPLRGPIPPLQELELPEEPATSAASNAKKEYTDACIAYVRDMRQLIRERDEKYPSGGPILTHRPSNDELKAILLKALKTCKVPSIRQYYNSLLEIKNKNMPFGLIFDELRNLALAEQKTTSIGKKRTYHDNNNGSLDDQQSKDEEEKYKAVKAFLAVMDRDKNKKEKRPCANCKSTSHGTLKCESTKCGTCNKTFKTSDERKTHWDREHKGKRPQSKDDKDTQRTVDDNNQRRKQNRTVRFKAMRSHITDSSAQDAVDHYDDDRDTTDDDFDPNF